MRLYLPTTLLLSCLLAPTQAFPSGAGGCEGDGPAVGGLHLQPIVEDYSGPFNDAYFVTIADADTPDQTVRLEPEDAVFPGEAGVRYLLTLTPNPDYQDDSPVGIAFDPVAEFRGFLFRVSNIDNPSEDTTSYVEVVDPSYSSVASECTAINIGGITHIDDDLKSQAQAYVTFPSAGSYRIDITNVIKNRSEDSNHISQYGHSAYDVDIAGAPTTEAPISAPPASGPAPTASGSAPTAPVPAPTASGSAPTASAPTASAPAPTASGPTAGTSAGVTAIVSSALLLAVGGAIFLV